MSKILLFLILSILSLNCFGQLILRADNYTLIPASSIALNRDSGTNIYKCIVSIPSLGTIDLYIFRYDGYWYQTEFPNGLSLGSPKIKYRTIVQILSTDPPCNANWQLINQNWNINFSTHPTISPSSVIENVIIGGSGCSNQVNTSVTLLPKGVIVPVSTTVNIDAIQNPILGMIIYDLTVACLKIYNGTSWVCI